jgi:hypothetical protein
MKFLWPFVQLRLKSRLLAIKHCSLTEPPSCGQSFQGWEMLLWSGWGPANRCPDTNRQTTAGTEPAKAGDLQGGMAQSLKGLDAPVTSIAPGVFFQHRTSKTILHEFRSPPELI